MSGGAGGASARRLVEGGVSPRAGRGGASKLEGRGQGRAVGARGHRGDRGTEHGGCRGPGAGGARSAGLGVPARRRAPWQPGSALQRPGLLVLLLGPLSPSPGPGQGGAASRCESPRVVLLQQPERESCCSAKGRNLCQGFSVISAVRGFPGLGAPSVAPGPAQGLVTKPCPGAPREAGVCPSPEGKRWGMAVVGNSGWVPCASRDGRQEPGPEPAGGADLCHLLRALQRARHAGLHAPLLQGLHPGLLGELRPRPLLPPVPPRVPQPGFPHPLPAVRAGGEGAALRLCGAPAQDAGEWLLSGLGRGGQTPQEPCAATTSPPAPSPMVTSPTGVQGHLSLPIHYSLSLSPFSCLSFGHFLLFLCFPRCRA